MWGLSSHGRGREDFVSWSSSSSIGGRGDAQQRRKALLKATLAGEWGRNDGGGDAGADDDASSEFSQQRRAGNGKDFVLDCYCECRANERAVVKRNKFIIIMLAFKGYSLFRFYPTYLAAVAARPWSSLSWVGQMEKFWNPFFRRRKSMAPSSKPSQVEEEWDGIGGH